MSDFNQFINTATRESTLEGWMGQGQITCKGSSTSWHMIASWHYQMETFSALVVLCEGNPPVASGFTGGFPSQMPVTRSFDVFDLCLNKHLNKQSRRRWIETLSHSLCEMATILRRTPCVKYINRMKYQTTLMNDAMQMLNYCSFAKEQLAHDG